MNKIIAVALGLLVFSCQSMPGKPAEPDCGGVSSAAKASFGLVYLHGMDTPQLSAQEKSNREKLERISQQLGIRMAFPRATQVCPGEKEKLCWSWSFSETDLTAISDSIEQSAITCHLPKTVVVLGFSNGGYAVNKIFEQCVLGRDQTLISIGAGNNYVNKLKVKSCGKLTLLVGSKDEFNSADAKQYTDTVKTMAGEPKLIEFAGGHEIPEAELLQVLQSITPSEH